MTSLSTERKGELLILLQAMIYGLFPVVLSASGGKIPPFFFAATSTFLSTLVIFVYLIATKKTADLKNTKALPYCLKLAFFITLGYCLFYPGGSQTSGINIAILAQMEIVFTFLFAGLIFGEKMPKNKLISAAFVFLGTMMIVYNGELSTNPGDLLILAATVVFPFANWNAKRAMNIISPQAVLVYRSFFSSMVFFIITFIWEGTLVTGWQIFQDNMGLILLNGLIVFALTKIFWYQGLQKIGLSKAITLAMTFTAFGMVYSMILLGERPTIYQLLGFVIVMSGVYIITKKDGWQKRVPDIEAV